MFISNFFFNRSSTKDHKITSLPTKYFLNLSIKNIILPETKITNDNFELSTTEIKHKKIIQPEPYNSLTPVLNDLYETINCKLSKFNSISTIVFAVLDSELTDHIKYLDYCKNKSIQPIHNDNIKTNLYVKNIIYFILKEITAILNKIDNYSIVDKKVIKLLSDLDTNNKKLIIAKIKNLTSIYQTTKKRLISLLENFIIILKNNILILNNEFNLKTDTTSQKNKVILNSIFAEPLNFSSNLKCLLDPDAKRSLPKISSINDVFIELNKTVSNIFDEKNVDLYVLSNKLNSLYRTALYTSICINT